MPRLGSSCDDRVLRVPNDTSLRIVRLMLAALISDSIALMSCAGGRPAAAVAGAAAAGAAAAPTTAGTVPSAAALARACRLVSPRRGPDSSDAACCEGDCCGGD